MHLFRHLSELAHFKSPLSLALGVFDGVHLGHKAVIREAVRQARKRNGNMAILTFHPHPAKILRPESAPRLLTTEQQDYELFSALDVDVCVILDFNQELSLCPAERFLDQLLRSVPTLQVVVVGTDYRFGYKREGNFQLIKSWTAKHALRAIEVAPVSVKGEVVSSTLIRNRIASGNIMSANKLLGRSYQMVGRVVRGKGWGSRLGFPTANFEVESELIPASGVYAGRALCEGQVFAAAINIGCRPTFSGSHEVTVEAHLLNFEGDLYRHHIRLDFLDRIREEKKFQNADELKVQIESDCQKVWRRASL